MLTRSITAVLLLLGLSTAVSNAATPQGTAFSYQGVVRQNGAPLNGNADLVLELFDAATGGVQVGPSLVYTAANGNPVTVVNGTFNLVLDFGPAAFNGPTTDQRYLRVTINGVPLAPRTPIQNAPYALQARTAELAYTVPNGAIGAPQVDSASIQRRVAGTCSAGSSIRTIAPDGSVSCQVDENSGTLTGVVAGTGLTGGGTSGSVGVAADTNYLQRRVGGNCAAGSSINSIGPDGAVGCQPDANSGGTITGVSAGRGMSGGGAAGSVALGIVHPLTLSGADNGNGVVYVDNTSGSGVSYGLQGRVASPQGVAIQGSVQATTGTAIGISGRAAAPNGIGVLGVNNAGSGSSTGVSGTTSSPTGFGVAGYAGVADGQFDGVQSAGVYGRSTSGEGAGVWGSSSGGNGYGGWGVFGESVSGIGVMGKSQSFAGVWGESVSHAGVYGYSASSDGVIGSTSSSSRYGVLGLGSQGVRGEARTSGGFGVVGYYADNTTTTGRGVYGQSDATAGAGVHGYSPGGFGIYGSTSSGYAGYFTGAVYIAGPLTKPLGSFLIDHPLDPEGKYLYHSFVESPDMKNIYDGTATLDSRGEAWVEMPGYFEALNREFRYQLTALGSPAPGLYIADEIAANRFRIAGGITGQRVSWQVTGTRHDRYAEEHRIQVEVDKDAKDRGKYLYPELYGKPASQAVHPLLPPAPASSYVPPSPGEQP